MKKLSIILAAALLAAQIGLLPVFAGGSDLYTEDFNSTSQAVLQDGGDFTYVERPADGTAVDQTPVAEGAGKDRVLLSGKKDNRKASFKMADVEGAVDGSIGGIVIFEGDFRMEGRPAYINDTTKKSPSGTVKFFDFLSGTTSVFTLGMGTFTDTGFNLRPLYADSETGKNVTGGGVTLNGKALEYRKWYHFKAELDMENGKVTAMVDNVTIVDNQNFYGNVNKKPLLQIQATHANGTQVDSSNANNAHLQPFLLDNIRVYRNKTNVGGVTSDVYTISEHVISNIPDATEVAAFLSNITLPEGAAEAKVYSADGTTERTSGAVENGDWLKVEPDGPSYRLQLESCLYFEPFDGPPQSTTTVGAGWKLIERPADGTVINYDTVTEATENAGADRVLLSKALSGGKVTMDTGKLTGKFTLQYQFRVEEQSSTLAAGGLRLISLMGTASGTTKDAVGLSTGSSSAEGFHLRPIYGPKGTALNDKGPTLAYRTWHTAVICVDVENNSASIRINGQNIFDTDTVSLWNDTFQDITQLQFYGKSTAAVNFMIDSVQIVRTPVIAQAQSTVYTVNQEEKSIKNVPYGTEVNTFLANITYTENGSGSLTDSDGNAKTGGAVVTGDKLVVTPGGVTYTMTVNPQPQARSTTYAVDQEAKTVTGVPFDIAVNAFLGNITYTENGSGSLTDSGGNVKTSGAVVTGDKLTVTPGGMVYIITVDPQPPVNVALAQSTVYIVVQSSHTITGVPYGTGVAAFLGNITYTENGSGSLTDGSGNAKTSGTVVTGDKLVAAPGDTVYTITVNAKPIAQSSVYTVNQSEKTIMGVPYGTGITAFLGNITYTENGSGSLTDSDGNAKTGGAVVTGDKLVVTPGDTIYTITVDARPEVPSQVQSGVYDVNQTEMMIRGVAPETEVAAFLGNLTYTEGGSGTLHSSDGQEKTTGTVFYTDTLTVEPGGKVYHILTTDILTYLDFNDRKIPPAGWKMNADTYHAMQRPLGGETDPGLTTVPNPNDYALYSGGSNNSAANQATFALRQAEDVEITMDFLVKQRVDDANANQIKLVELVVERKNETEPSAQSLAVCNVATTTGFVITHYPGNGTSVGRQNQAFGTDDWGTWHTLKVLASTKRNSATVWLDGTLVGTAEFQGAKKDSNILTAIRFYNGKRADYTAAAPSPYYVDNIKIKTVSGECAASSEIYRVQDTAISGILKGTTVDTFRNNIRIPAGATAAIYSVYDAQTPQNNVQRTEGALVQGDTLVVTAADGFSTAVYHLRTAAPAEIYFTDMSGQEITAVSQLDGGKMKVVAEIYNNGAFGNNTTFVLVVTAYKGNEMVKANYKRATVPLGQTKSVVEMEPITVEDGLTYNACVWDELIPMIPLSLPKDIDE